MAVKQGYTIKTIQEYHQLMGLQPPKHPQLSVICFSAIQRTPFKQPVKLAFNFYSISIKKINKQTISSQQDPGIDLEGIMCFMAPGLYFDLLPSETQIDLSGKMVLIDPDFLLKSSLAKAIKQYDFFDYAFEHALCPSSQEAGFLNSVIGEIEKESIQNIDQFSHELILIHLELLIKYADRLYHRQFLIRKNYNHQIIKMLHEVLGAYFDGSVPVSRQIPSVQYIANALNISTSYLNGLLKAASGQSTQQHIHNKLIELAKEKLVSSESSVSQIAYELGFEHPQSLSKLFRIKTNMSPIEFRKRYH